MDTQELPMMRGPVGAAAGPAGGALAETPPQPREDDAAEPAWDVPSRQVTEPLMALDFAVHTSLRYHAKRRAWFDNLHRVALGVIALGSAAAVAALSGELYDAGTDLTFAVAVAAALDLFFAFAERARAEDGLFRRWTALATEIAEAQAIDDGMLRLWDKRRLLIRADCEERLLVLHRICYNLEAEARGFPEEALYAVTPLQRLMAPLISLPPHRPRRLPA